VHGLPRNDLVVSIGLKAIVLLFFWRFYRGVRESEFKDIELQVEIFCFTFCTYYVGIEM
jgi:hypothetical protein